MWDERAGPRRWGREKLPRGSFERSGRESRGARPANGRMDGRREWESGIYAYCTAFPAREWTGLGGGSRPSCETRWAFEEELCPTRQLSELPIYKAWHSYAAGAGAPRSRCSREGQLTPWRCAPDATGALPRTLTAMLSSWRFVENAPPRTGLNVG